MEKQEENGVYILNNKLYVYVYMGVGVCAWVFVWLSVCIYMQNRNTQQLQPPSGSFISFGESFRTTSCTIVNKW